MRNVLILCMAAGGLLTSCQSVIKEDILGVYVREYTRTQRNIQTEKEVGEYITRDTIFITGTDNGYSIRNTRWRKNDYDDEGWKKQSHGSDRAMPAYTAIYSESDSTLTDLNGFAPQLYMDPGNGTLSKNHSGDPAWIKIPE